MRPRTSLDVIHNLYITISCNYYTMNNVLYPCTTDNYVISYLTLGIVLTVVLIVYLQVCIQYVCDDMKGKTELTCLNKYFSNLWCPCILTRGFSCL